MHDIFKRGALCAVGVAGCVFTGTARSAILVATPATITSVFAAAAAGDTLELIGTFGNVRLQGRSFTTAVTLDASHALFTDTLILQKDHNLKLWRGNFDIAGGSSYGRGVAIWGGSNITVDQTTVHGNGSEVGVVFEGTAHAIVSNGKFDGLRAAIGFGEVIGGVVSGNRIIHAVADGIDIGDSHYVKASYNTCSLGTPGAGVHPDCIQLWSTTGHPVQSDITVSHNKATGPTQGFTSFSSGGGGLRVAITYNSVTSSYPQGIACYDCVNSTISFNKVWTLPGAAHITNINVIGGTGNKVVGNIINLPVVANGSAFTASRALSPRPGVALGRGTYSPVLEFSGRYDGVNAVPEPRTWDLLLAGFAAVGVICRRRAAVASPRLSPLFRPPSYFRRRQVRL